MADTRKTWARYALPTLRSTVWLLMVLAMVWPSTAPAQHVVFVTGEEEYRSEESMPMLARILKRDYGFEVTVLYSLDEQGVIEVGPWPS